MQYIKEQTITQLQTYLVLLQTKETFKTYKEFCYQLYLISLHNDDDILGAVQTKSLKGALKGAVTGAVGAVAAVGVVSATAKVFNITKAVAHASSFIESGVNKVSLFKAAAHGLTRGAIQSMQGGKFKAGFFSGLASGFDVGTKGHGGFVGRTAIMGIVGGTASSLGGGKFSNGAMSGAFVHMFNAEGVAKKIIDSTSEAVSHYYHGGGEPVELGIKTKLALRTNPAQINHFQNIASGRTSSLIGNYGIDLTGSSTTFHVGDTRVDYFTSCGSSSCTTTFVGFSGDGFWDIYGGNDYGGPQGELGGTPYAYKPYIWTEKYANPYK